MKTSFKGITIFTKSIQTTTAFFSAALGLKVNFQSPNFAEIIDDKGLTIILKEVDLESYCTTGYNPILNFEVEDIDVIESKLLQYGASVDGKKRENKDFKIGSYRSPDGIMLSLIQLSEETEGYLAQPEKFGDEKRGKGQDGDEIEDENLKEIKHILNQIKL